MTHLNKKNWYVADVSLDTARVFVNNFHYSAGGSNTRVACHGLFNKETGGLWGVTWWLPPTKVAAQSVYPEDFSKVISLSRLVILPGAPTNSASFLLSRSRKSLGPNWKCALTYADTWRGHSGAIYRADNWEYLGETRPGPVWLRGGVMVSRKAGPKTKTRDQMVAAGCELVGNFPKHKFRKLLS